MQTRGGVEPLDLLAHFAAALTKRFDSRRDRFTNLLPNRLSRLIVFALLAVIAIAAFAGTHSLNAQVICAGVNQIPQSECQALRDLYISTDGDNWKKNDNWNGLTAPCDWYGVLCTGGHVTELQLRKNNLTGTLSRSIINLTELTDLELDGNRLSGNIPALPGALQSLIVEGNQLSGRIPALPASLRSLIVGDNQLSGEVPISITSTTIETGQLDLWRRFQHPVFDECGCEQLHYCPYERQ